MDLPINLFFILQGKIQLFEGTAKATAKIDVFGTNTSQQHNNINSNTNLIKTENINTIPSQNYIKPEAIEKNNKMIDTKPSIEFPQKQIDNQLKDPKDLFKKETYNILDSLLKEINNKTTALEVFKAIHKIITNIISNPNEEKFRRLKKDSNFYKNNIAPYTKAKVFLEYLLFTHSNDNLYYEYLGDEEYLIKVGEILNDFLIERSKIN